MLQLDFQTESFALEANNSLNSSGFSPHNKMLIPNVLVDEPGANDQFSVPNQRSELAENINLDFQVEERLFDNMRSSGLSVLLIFADEPSLSEALKSIILDIEEDLDKYHAVDSGRLSAESLDLLGTIDAVETMFYIGDKRHLIAKRNRLKRRLSEWSPPTYLIINCLNAFLASSGRDLDKSLSRRLKKASLNYSNYRNRMVQANLRLVYSVANKFRYLGLPYEDLVQEGNLGLIKAVERFNFAKGFRFSTYAHIVISQSIHLAIDKQGSLVRLPFKALREKASVEKVRQKLEQSLGRTPTINELNEHLPSDLEYKSTHISNAVEPNASSQHLYSTPDDSELIEQCSAIEEDLKTSSLSRSDIVYRVLDQLNEREAYIVRMRFGIGLSKEFTLEEISQTIGLSRERVRQLSHQAIEKLSICYQNNGGLNP